MSRCGSAVLDVAGLLAILPVLVVGGAVVVAAVPCLATAWACWRLSGRIDPPAEAPPIVRPGAVRLSRHVH